MLGPIDYIVVGFKGNNFDGSVLKELSKAIDSGVIRLVDLLFVVKYEDGSIEMAEAYDQADDIKEVAKLLGHSDATPLLSASDVEKIGNLMVNDSSAGMLVIEQLWAKRLKQALIDKGAVLIDEGRLHPEVIEAALEEIQTVPA